MLAVWVLHIASESLPYMSTKKHPLQQGVSDPIVVDVVSTLVMSLSFVYISAGDQLI